ncbi:MAG: anhydro-N-acetylmuramic acid kinase [Betaproteobacteria bacterium]|nr:MAG: anhydro-N-acetylmuramic acid kinase [Betaproteobacteria bacterium]
MSGTSLDGVDAALVDFSERMPRVVKHAHLPFEDRLRAELLALAAPGTDDLGRAANMANELARRYAAAVAAVLEGTGIARRDVVAIGCHGQTVRHRPDLGYTVQIGNAALLAELTALRVVADFRSRDVAAGGQGAPLVPAFHAAVFAKHGEDRAVLNLGGIANLTLLSREGHVTGFDTGPGNCLMDLWAARHLGMPCDRDGAWASGGSVMEPLLDAWLGAPYFTAPPPKSTGREMFGEAWLRRELPAGAAPQDVQATLLELTARSAAAALQLAGLSAQRVIACGGGTRNRMLMRRMQMLLEPAQVESSSQYGLDPQQVEAVAFAWLAMQAVNGKPANIPAVTGARGARVLGAIYPA